MSFLGGAECSTSNNPLGQFAKHVQGDDRGQQLQRDGRFAVGRNGGGTGGGAAVLNGFRGLDDTAAAAADFETRRSAGDEAFKTFQTQAAPFPDAFALHTPSQNSLHAGLPHYDLHAEQQSLDPRSWAQEFKPGTQDHGRTSSMGAASASTFNPAEFQRFQHMSRQDSARSASPLMQGTSNPYTSRMAPRVGMGLGMGMNSSGMLSMNGAGMYRPQLHQPNIPVVASNGKGKMIELDDEHWEEQFKRIDMQEQSSSPVLDTDEQAEQESRSVPRASETDEFGDFESIWRGIQAENLSNREAIMEQWTGFDDIGIHDFPSADPMLGQYTFEPDNLFSSTTSPYDEGLRIVRSDGNLSLAALAFEAAVQNDPSHLAAWLALGSVQAQNEKETPAIRALEQALILDPNNLNALMGLAISYTNDGYDSTAYRTLERWLSVKYPQIVSPSELSTASEVGFTDRHALHERVSNLFIQAAQLSPEGASMDPDVQVGLGVLFYSAEQYDKAVDCFGSALASNSAGTVNQQDQLHLLWNRLGATLANSGRSAEATSAYARALELKRNFVRARYNLGVSCVNLGTNESAVGHFLGALEMHAAVEREGLAQAAQIAVQARAAGTSSASVPAATNTDADTYHGAEEDAAAAGLGSTSDADAATDRYQHLVQMNQSTNLFDTLRRVLIQMDRRELADKVGPGMDLESFRGEFDF